MLNTGFWRRWEPRLYHWYYHYLPWPSQTRKRWLILQIHRYCPWLSRHTASYRMLPHVRHGDLRGIDIDAARRQAHDYSTWRAAYGVLSGRERRRLRRAMKRLDCLPKLGVFIIAGGVAENVATEQSLRHQIFQPAQVRSLGHGMAPTDMPVDYVVMLRAGVRLHEAALAYIAEAIVKRLEGRLFYVDEEWSDLKGHLLGPWFKPDWDPNLMLNHNLAGALAVYYRDDLTGYRYDAGDPAWDYDLALQVSEKLTAQQIIHIPRVLASCVTRKLTGESIMMMIERALARRAVAAVVTPSPLVADAVRVRYELPSPAPCVSLIIPTRNGLTLLRRCLDTLVAKTDYSPYEILVVDNGSDEPDAVAFLATLKQRYSAVPLRVIREDSPFNFSRLNNQAVEQAKGELIGLLNNDLEVIDGAWLREMVSQACRPGIGAVGARLLYPDGRLQHAGVIVGLGGAAGHVLRYEAADRPDRLGPPGLGRSRLVQSFSAVTAACLVVRKCLYQEVGGLDEELFPVAYNDVDFCLKLQRSGYRNLYTPFATLYHYESASRGSDDDDPVKAARWARELTSLQRRWSTWDYRDPAYSPNLTAYGEDCGYSYPPRL